MRLTLTVIALLIPATTLLAQIPENDPDFMKGGRISVSARKELTPRIELRGESEFRMAGRLLRDMRLKETVGVSYKVAPWLKAGAGYSYIGKMEYRSDYSSRHRVNVDLTGQYKTGPWKFSLRERVQLTHRFGGNPYQHTRNTVELRSRAQVSYKLSKKLSPFVSGELMNILNGPTLAEYSFNPTLRRYETAQGTETGERGWMIAGHDDSYLNRIRGMAGMDIKKNKRSSFKVYAMLDWCYDLRIDTNGKGTRLNSLVYDPTWKGYLCGAYTYSF